MRLSDLETLVAAVRAGSLTAAARRLFISQPAVSARLRRLEQETGEPLLRRSGQGVRPTAAGELLFDRARALLDQVRRLEQEMASGEISGRLSVGATDLAAIYHLPAALQRFRRLHPQCELALQVDGTAPLLRLLEAGMVELVVGTFPVTERGIEMVPLYHDPLTILAPSGHRLARRRILRPEEMAEEVWILHKPESVTRQLVESFFAAHQIRPRVEMEISSPEAIKKLVQARLGLAVLPACAVRREVADGRLATLRVRGFHLERASGLLLRAGTPLSRAADAFRKVVAETAGVKRASARSVPGTRP